MWSLLLSSEIVEKETIPASSQGLPTSEILSMSLPHFSHFILTSSIQGLWGVFPSNLSQPATALSLSSSLLPITSKCLQDGQTQIGRASPQKRFLERTRRCLF